MKSSCLLPVVTAISFLQLSGACFAEVGQEANSLTPKAPADTSSADPVAKGASQPLPESALKGVKTEAQSQGSGAAANAGGKDKTSKAEAQAADETLPASAGQAMPPGKKVTVKPGQELSIGTDTDALVTTDDIAVAKAQVAKYPDNPEAHFILAVALTRTSAVEEALQEVRRARRLAQSQGGTGYFDKMIEADEKMLTYSPDENRVRYSLAWAYYMKAYLIGQAARRANPQAYQASRPAIAVPDFAQSLAKQVGIKAPAQITPIKGALDGVAPQLQGEIKKNFEAALANLDDLLKRDPKDVWAIVYRAHLKAEYTGNLDQAMDTWEKCKTEYPDNPAPYFFLGEGFLKKGNLKDSLGNISKAIALRAMGH